MKIDFSQKIMNLDNKPIFKPTEDQSKGKNFF
jgi:hypothetical protein